MSNQKRDKTAWYDYTVTGTLEKTEPNRRPTQFLVRGKYIEKSDADTAVSRRGNTSVLIPKNIEDQSNFLQTVPLGTKVRFRESARRNNKLYTHSFSIEVVEGK